MSVSLSDVGGNVGPLLVIVLIAFLSIYYFLLPKVFQKKVQKSQDQASDKPNNVSKENISSSKAKNSSKKSKKDTRSAKKVKVSYMKINESSEKDDKFSAKYLKSMDNKSFNIKTASQKFIQSEEKKVSNDDKSQQILENVPLNTSVEALFEQINKNDSSKSNSQSDSSGTNAPVEVTSKISDIKMESGIETFNQELISMEPEIKSEKEIKVEENQMIQQLSLEKSSDSSLSINKKYGILLEVAEKGALAANDLQYENFLLNEKLSEAEKNNEKLSKEYDIYQKNVEEELNLLNRELYETREANNIKVAELNSNLMVTTESYKSRIAGQDKAISKLESDIQSINSQLQSALKSRNELEKVLADKKQDFVGFLEYQQNMMNLDSTYSDFSGKNMHSNQKKDEDLENTSNDDTSSSIDKNSKKNNDNDHITRFLIQITNAIQKKYGHSPTFDSCDADDFVSAFYTFIVENNGLSSDNSECQNQSLDK
ncbi:MAG: hypothetical protein MHPSP_002840, partial [Paramarteilia canceri]